MCCAQTQGSPLRFIVLCAIILLGTGCASSLQIDSSFPEPLVETLPVDVGVYYDESLRHFAYQRQAGAKSAAWDIELGEIHVTLFDQVLHPLFQNLVQMDTLEPSAATPPVVTILEPEIVEYILMTPLDISRNYYEVTIRYSLAFHSPSGDLIKRWSFSGHGKSRASMFSNSETVQKATIAAMRDAAAWLVIELTRKPGIMAILQTPESDNENEALDHES